MKWLADIFYFFVRSLLYRQALKSARRKGILIYLKTLQVVRRSLAASIFVFFILQSLFFGFMGCIVTGVFLLPEELHTKLWILLGVFLTLFLVPLASLIILLSDRMWFKLSGAQKMLSE